MNTRMKETADTVLFANTIAGRRDWVLNPDDKFRGKVVEGLTRNYNRYGYFLCPCRDGDGDREADRDLCCPCAYARQDIAEFGQCFCGFFLSPERAKRIVEGDEPSNIPERRPDEPELRPTQRS